MSRGDGDTFLGPVSINDAGKMMMKFVFEKNCLLLSTCDKRLMSRRFWRRWGVSASKGKKELMFEYRLNDESHSRKCGVATKEKEKKRT